MSEVPQEAGIPLLDFSLQQAQSSSASEDLAVELPRHARSTRDSDRATAVNLAASFGSQSDDDDTKMKDVIKF